jgi:hypothetical protein
MNYREFSSSRRAICTRRAEPRGYVLEASPRDCAKCPCGQRWNGSRPVPAGCRNISCLIPPQAQSARCSPGDSEVLRGERSRHHDAALTLRHRRIPEESEVAEPSEAGSPGEEDTAEEDGPVRSEDADAETPHGNPSRCPSGDT